MMKRRLCSVLLAFVLLLTLLPTVAFAVDEQFSLTPGGTYYFDLSGEGIPGTANTGNNYGVAPLPDTSLHYVPFTYAGTINAYKLTSKMATTEEYAEQNKYDHSLFIADYVVMQSVSWDTLNENGLIFGKSYSSGGVSYTMRAPSVGSYYYAELEGLGDDPSERGTPKSNEWDAVLNKNEGYIRNWNSIYSWGQDTSIDPVNQGNSYRSIRGCVTLRRWTVNSADNMDEPYGFRPVLEIQSSNNLTTDGLKVVALDLTKAQLSGSNEIKIVVKSGSDFTAPASKGLSVPTEHTLKWVDSDGNTYDPGTTNVPANVTKLTAVVTPNTYTVTLDADGGTINSGEVMEYTYGIGATLPTDVTKTGYNFLGWYSGDEKVTSIGKTETGDKSFAAKWQASTYTVTLHPNGGTIADGKNVTSYTYGVGATLPTDVTRESYTFKGWYDNEAMTGSPVAAISSTDIDNKEYWAKWEPITYTISYELDGGKAEGNPESYTIETETIMLVNPTRSGYAFTGWSGTGLDGAENMTVTIEKGSTGERTYTAHWRANRYYYYSGRQTAAPVTSPGTADDSAMGLWGLLLCASLAAGYAVTAAQRRRER